MKIHQIITQSPGNTQYRNASCQMNCEYPDHELKEFSFNTPKQEFKGSGNRNNKKAKTPWDGTTWKRNEGQTCH